MTFYKDFQHWIMLILIYLYVMHVVNGMK